MKKLITTGQAKLALVIACFATLFPDAGAATAELKKSENSIKLANGWAGHVSGKFTTEENTEAKLTDEDQIVFKEGLDFIGKLTVLLAYIEKQKEYWSSLRYHGVNIPELENIADHIFEAKIWVGLAIELIELLEKASNSKKEMGGEAPNGDGKEDAKTKRK